MQYVQAEAIWPGETCYIVAGGPSLRGFDFSRLEGRKVIVINSSVFSYPAADVLFFGDARWWGWHAMQVRSIFKGIIFTASEATDGRLQNLHKRLPPPVITESRGEVTMRHTSLTATLNLAFHFGVSRIILLGADQQAASDGMTHHHQPHPAATLPGCWDKQILELRDAGESLKALGIEVINTSLGSRIDWWPKQSIEDFL